MLLGRSVGGDVDGGGGGGGVGTPGFTRSSKKGDDLRGNRTPNLRVWNPTRCHCAMKSCLQVWAVAMNIRHCQMVYGIADLAERLRRTLKARVRKSVGSIPTVCNNTNFFWYVAWSPCTRVIYDCLQLPIHTSAYSSVGRAGDCRWLQLISLGHWFDSGCADLFFFGSVWSIKV
jgi:hypothetical protein